MNFLSIMLYLLFAVITVQTSPEEVVIGFASDLKENERSNKEIVEKYFLFREKITQKEKREVIFPMLTEQLDLLRRKLNEDCPRPKVIKHDDNLDIVKLYRLRYSNFNNVYYITCEDSILLPVLVNNGRITSITTHSKIKNGTRGFMIY